MSEKITSQHLDQAAYVYVRQSTSTQVRHNLEGQRRQYDLENRARELGFRSVTVIDDDLGVSGSGHQHRPGFARLLAAVCEGRVGAVFALEASRLSRNSRDWHHLIDLCALTGTLVVDYDGVYDPRLLNDRLLLGLKGTMSEFELGVLRQRAQEALREMIRRGEVLKEVAVGYIRTEDNRCEMHPDRQVQEALRGVFDKFQELGSARQVLLWYQEDKLPLPRVKQGTCGQAISWGQATNARILSILKNPVYAGAFVHGRTKTQTRVIDGRPHKSQSVVPMDEWEVLIKDHHSGYITWKQFLRNRRQLYENSQSSRFASTGAPKSGRALLTGLLRCARCFHKLYVGYSGVDGQIHRYQCHANKTDYGAKKCISFGGRKVDEAVATRVLEAVRPAGVRAALDAWEKLTESETEASRQMRLALERACYETERARRQYDAVEPENRLVSAELESRWNKALSTQQGIEGRLKEVSLNERAVSTEEREQLLALGQDLEAVWNNPKSDVTLKKRILRTVIEEVIVDVEEEAPEIVLRLHWVGGLHTRLKVRKQKTGHHYRKTNRNVVDLIRELSQMCEDSEIAALLNRLGYRTATGKSWRKSRVQSVRKSYGIPALDTSAPRRWITLKETARRLKVSERFVRRLLDEGVLPGRQVIRQAPWMIKPTSLDLPAVQAAVKSRKVPRARAAQKELSLFSTT